MSNSGSSPSASASLHLTVDSPRHLITAHFPNAPGGLAPVAHACIYILDTPTSQFLDYSVAEGGTQAFRRPWILGKMADKQYKYRQEISQVRCNFCYIETFFCLHFETGRWAMSLVHSPVVVQDYGMGSCRPANSVASPVGVLCVLYKTRAKVNGHRRTKLQKKKYATLGHGRGTRIRRAGRRQVFAGRQLSHILGRCPWRPHLFSPSLPSSRSKCPDTPAPWI